MCYITNQTSPTCTHSLQRTLPCDFFIPQWKVSKKELRFHALTLTVLLVVAFSKVRRIAIDARQREISLITWLFSYDINTVRIIIDGTTVLNLVSVCIANLIRFNTSFLSLIILALLIFNHWILPTSSKGSLHNCSRQCLGGRLSYLTPAHLLLRCPWGCACTPQQCARIPRPRTCLFWSWGSLNLSHRRTRADLGG